MKHDVSQIIHWLRIARDYTEEVPEYDDPENTLKGILAHLDSAIAALVALASEPEPLAEGWAFLDDRHGFPWHIAWLQERSSSARYLVVYERKPDA